MRCALTPHVWELLRKNSQEIRMSNTQRLEALIQRQRKILSFAQSAWDQAQEENTLLRQVIAELQTRLEAHGISSAPTPINSKDQLILPLFSKTP